MDSVSKTYCFLWDRKDKDCKVSMTWKELSRYYNKNAFRTSVRKLNSEGLISYDESEDGISIELVGWEDVTDS